MQKLTRFTLYHSLSQDLGPHKRQNLNDKEVVELCFENDKPQFLKRLRTFVHYIIKIGKFLWRPGETNLAPLRVYEAALNYLPCYPRPSSYILWRILRPDRGPEENGELAKKN